MNTLQTEAPVYQVLYTIPDSLKILVADFREKSKALSDKIEELIKNPLIDFVGVKFPNGKIELEKGERKKCPFFPI